MKLLGNVLDDCYTFFFKTFEFMQNAIDNVHFMTSNAFATIDVK